MAKLQKRLPFLHETLSHRNESVAFFTFSRYLSLAKPFGAEICKTGYHVVYLCLGIVLWGRQPLLPHFARMTLSDYTILRMPQENSTKRDVLLIKFLALWRYLSHLDKTSMTHSVMNGFVKVMPLSLFTPSLTEAQVYDMISCFAYFCTKWFRQR